MWLTTVLSGDPHRVILQFNADVDWPGFDLGQFRLSTDGVTYIGAAGIASVFPRAAVLFNDSDWPAATHGAFYLIGFKTANLGFPQQGVVA